MSETINMKVTVKLKVCPGCLLTYRVMHYDLCSACRKRQRCKDMRKRKSPCNTAGGPLHSLHEERVRVYQEKAAANLPLFTEVPELSDE